MDTSPRRVSYVLIHRRSGVCVSIHDAETYDSVLRKLHAELSSRLSLSSFSRHDPTPDPDEDKDKDKDKDDPDSTRVYRGVQLYDSSGREYLESDFPLYRSDPSSRFLFIRVPSIDGEGGEGNGVEGNGAASSGHSFSASDRLVDVEIVPDIHLLLQAGDEYDFYTSLDEVIDNAIQSLVASHFYGPRSPSPSSSLSSSSVNGHSYELSPDRLAKDDCILIETCCVSKNDMFGDMSDGAYLFVADTGIGMDAEDLKRWATMGSTSFDFSSFDTLEDATFQRRTRSQNTSDSTDKYLSGFFGRYGVGSKRAMFNLGEGVVAYSRKKGDRDIFMCSLQKSKLTSSSEGQGASRDRGKWMAQLGYINSSELESLNVEHVNTERSVFFPFAKVRDRISWIANHVSSFSFFLIGPLRPLYSEEYFPALLRRHLAHVYHYYIYGKSGNTQYSDRSSNSLCSSVSIGSRHGSLDEEFDEPSSKGVSSTSHRQDVSTAKDPTPLISIFVESEDIRSEVDGETLYLSSGRLPFRFSLPLSSRVPVGNSSGGFRLIRSVVHGELMYYPFVNGMETLPIPADDEQVYLANRRLFRELVDISKQNVDEFTYDGHDLNSPELFSANCSVSQTQTGTLSFADEIHQLYPLSKRQSGFECFWLGRLLPNEHIPELSFMKRLAVPSSDIPAHVFQRIRGRLFFDGGFEVSQNKLYLVRTSNIFRALTEYEDRSLTQNFREWLRQCHKTLDEEVFFDTSHIIRTVNDKCYYNRVKYGSINVRVGDAYVLRNRSKSVVTVSEIFRDLSSDSYLCFLSVTDMMKDETSVEPLTKIASKATTRDIERTRRKKEERIASVVQVLHVVLDNDSSFEEPKELILKAGTGIKELKCCYLNRLGTTVTNHRSMFVQITNVVSGAHVEIPNTSPQQGIFRYHFNGGVFKACGKYSLQAHDPQTPSIAGASVEIEIVPSDPVRAFLHWPYVTKNTFENLYRDLKSADCVQEKTDEDFLPSECMTQLHDDLQVPGETTMTCYVPPLGDEFDFSSSMLWSIDHSLPPLRICVVDEFDNCIVVCPNPANREDGTSGTGSVSTEIATSLTQSSSFHLISHSMSITSEGFDGVDTSGLVIEFPSSPQISSQVENLASSSRISNQSLSLEQNNEPYSLEISGLKLTNMNLRESFVFRILHFYVSGELRLSRCVDNVELCVSLDSPVPPVVLCAGFPAVLGIVREGPVSLSEASRTLDVSFSVGLFDAHKNRVFPQVFRGLSGPFTSSTLPLHMLRIRLHSDIFVSKPYIFENVDPFSGIAEFERQLKLKANFQRFVENKFVLEFRLEDVSGVSPLVWERESSLVMPIPEVYRLRVIYPETWVSESSSQSVALASSIPVPGDMDSESIPTFHVPPGSFWDSIWVFVEKEDSTRVDPSLFTVSSSWSGNVEDTSSSDLSDIVPHLQAVLLPSLEISPSAPSILRYRVDVEFQNSEISPLSSNFRLIVDVGDPDHVELVSVAVREETFQSQEIMSQSVPIETSRSKHSCLQIPCLETVRLSLRLCDSFRNSISIVESLLELLKSSVSFEVSSPDDFSLEECPVTCSGFKLDLGHVETRDRRARRRSRNSSSSSLSAPSASPGVLVVSFSVAGKVHIPFFVRIAFSSLRRDESVEFSSPLFVLEPGPPEQILVNGEGELSLEVDPFHLLPSFLVSIVDKFSNTIVDSDFVVNLQSDSTTLVIFDASHGRAVLFPSGSDISSEEGSVSEALYQPERTPSGLFYDNLVAFYHSGSCQLFFSLESESGEDIFVPPATIRLTLRPSCLPQTLELGFLDRSPVDFVVAGSSFPAVKAALTFLEGTQVHVPISVARLDFKLADGEFSSIPFDSFLPPTSIDAVESSSGQTPSAAVTAYLSRESSEEVSLTKSGVVVIRGVLDLLPDVARICGIDEFLRESIASTLSGLLELSCMLEFVVRHGPATALQCVSDIRFPCTATLVSVGSSVDVVENLQLQVTDQWGNACEDYAEAVTIEMICESDPEILRHLRLQCNCELLFRLGCWSAPSIGLVADSLDVCTKTLPLGIRFRTRNLSWDLPVVLSSDVHVRVRLDELNTAITQHEERVAFLGEQRDILKSVQSLRRNRLEELESEYQVCLDDVRGNIDFVKGIEAASLEPQKLKKRIQSRYRQYLTEHPPRACIFEDDRPTIRYFLDAREKKGSSTTGIIGLPLELGYVESEDLDRCIASANPKVLNTVVFRSMNDLNRWKKAISKDNGAVSMLALDMVSRPRDINYDERSKQLLFRNLENETTACGDAFVGYACNLVSFDESLLPDLRFVLFALLGDLLVFRSYEEAIEFRSRLISSHRRCPTIVCLDMERIEASGIVWGGQGASRVSKCRFGSLPPELSKHGRRYRDALDLLEKLISKLEELESFKHECSVKEGPSRSIRTFPTMDTIDSSFPPLTEGEILDMTDEEIIEFESCFSHLISELEVSIESLNEERQALFHELHSDIPVIFSSECGQRNRSNVSSSFRPSLRAREQRVSQHESVVASRADAEPSRRRTTKKRSSSEHSSVLEARIGSPLPKRVHSVTHRDSSPGTSSSLLSSPSASIQQGTDSPVPETRSPPRHRRRRRSRSIDRDDSVLPPPESDSVENRNRQKFHENQPERRHRGRRGVESSERDDDESGVEDEVEENLNGEDECDDESNDLPVEADTSEIGLRPRVRRQSRSFGSSRLRRGLKPLRSSGKA